MTEANKYLDENQQLKTDVTTFPAIYVDVVPQFMATSGEAIAMKWWVESVQDYQWNYISITETFDDGTFTCLAPDNGTFTVQPGDAQFKFLYLTREDGSKYTALTFNAKFRLTEASGETDASLGTFWEFAGKPLPLFEGWTWPKDD